MTINCKKLINTLINLIHNSAATQVCADRELHLYQYNSFPSILCKAEKVILWSDFIKEKPIQHLIKHMLQILNIKYTRTNVIYYRKIWNNPWCKMQFTSTTLPTLLFSLQNSSKETNSLKNMFILFLETLDSYILKDGSIANSPWKLKSPTR